MCSEREFELFKQGELILDYWDEVLIPKDAFDDEDSERYRTYDNYCDAEYDTFTDKYTTEKGEKVVAFGWYGYG